KPAASDLAAAICSADAAAGVPDPARRGRPTLDGIAAHGPRHPFLADNRAITPRASPLDGRARPSRAGAEHGRRHLIRVKKWGQEMIKWSLTLFLGARLPRMKEIEHWLQIARFFLAVVCFSILGCA